MIIVRMGRGNKNHRKESERNTLSRRGAHTLSGVLYHSPKAVCMYMVRSVVRVGEKEKR